MREQALGRFSGITRLFLWMGLRFVWLGNGKSNKLVHDPFLIDECLSPDLVAVANSRGHHATHVVHRGLQGTKDHGLMPTIFNEGFVFVTNNGRDFLKLYASQEIHPGLIIIVPGGIPPAVQVALFTCTLDVMETLEDIVNKVVEVFLDGTVKVRAYP
jgi:predicted nuclease of predicted toxin-antitoxin system